MLTKKEKLLLDLEKDFIDQFLCSQLFKSIANFFGLHVTRQKYYSSIPSSDELELHYSANEYKAIYNHASVFDACQLKSSLLELMDFRQNFQPPKFPDRSMSYYWGNPMFSHCDAPAYFSIVQKQHPKTIVEIGSGFSTHVAHAAVVNRNPSEIICFEPYPTKSLQSIKDITINKTKAQDLSPEYLNSILTDGDILFIDSTHTVKEGSDVIHIICNIIPYITKKIFVHFHDIFLPFSMPKEWTYSNNWYWEEQYLLYAYLLNNTKARVIYSSAFNAHTFPELMKKFTVSDIAGGGSLWFKLN